MNQGFTIPEDFEAGSSGVQEVGGGKGSGGRRRI